MLFGSDSLPNTLESVMPLAAGSLEFTQGTSLGVYWEHAISGQRVVGTGTLDVTLVIQRVDAGGGGGFFGRLFGRGARRAAQSVQWSVPADHRLAENEGNVASAVMVKTGDLDPGEYRLTLAVRGDGLATVESTRDITILAASGVR
jgi:hypothetical protein